MRNNVLGYQTFPDEIGYNSSQNHVSSETADKIDDLRQKLRRRGDMALKIAS